MKQLHALVAFCLAICLSGCASKGQVAPDRLPRGNTPGAASEKSYVAEQGDVESTTTIAVYPGAKVETKEKEVSATISPDESRYHVVLSTTDGLEKVRQFYERVLGAQAKNDPHGLGIFARTSRGNDVLLSMSNDGKKTTIDFKVIVYKH